VAAEEAAAMLLGAHPAVQEVTLRLDKPQALAGRARGASVEITRAREIAASETRPYGSRQLLFRSSEATLELVSIEPGQTARFTDAERRLEWLVNGELVELGDPPSAALATTSAHAVYTNRGAVPALVFRCLASEAREQSLAAE
jgi:hypothetical protein